MFLSCYCRKISARRSIRRVDDGLVVFETREFPSSIKTIGYINNCFLVLKETRLAAGQGIDEFMQMLVERPTWHEALRRGTKPNEHSFRIVLSDENRLISGDDRLIGRVGAKVQELTRMTWSPKGANVELWVLRRRDGMTYFCKRLSRRRRTERDLRKGELRPELALLLCRLSEPSENDVFLDPFAGSGAVPFARAQSRYNIIFIYESDPELVSRIKADLKAGKNVKERKRSPIIARVGDARHLDKIENCFIDKVVTDPPWGEFDCGIEDVAGFYDSILAELVRVTKPGGIIVMLLGRNEATERLIEAAGAQLRQEATFDILVSGKKAVVVKWRKPPLPGQ